MRLKSLLSRISTREFHSYLYITYIKVIEQILFNILCIFYENNRLKPFIKKSLLYLHLEIRKIADIEDYENLFPYSVKFIYKKESILYFSNPVYSEDKSIFRGLQKANGKNYSAILKSPCIIGGSNLILVENDNAIYDIAFANKNNNYKYIDGAIKLYKGDFCLTYYNKSIISLDQGIFVSGNFSWNFYHLLYEIIVKFKAIDEAGIDPEIPLLIDKVCSDIPQYSELYSIFNKSGRKVIILDYRKRYIVDKLFYFSCPNIVPPHFAKEIKINASDCLFDLTALDFLRSNLLPPLLEKQFPKRIFISRSKASDRRRYNEEEVLTLLESYGFIKISPENYSLTEQVSIFNQADFIAGGSGAAFTNLLFCKKSCRVICFTNYKTSLSIFSTITEYVGCNMTYVCDDSKTIQNRSRLHDPFNINIDKLKVFLSGWLESNNNG